MVRNRLQPGPRRDRAAHPPQHTRLSPQQDRTADWDGRSGTTAPRRRCTSPAWPTSSTTTA